MFTPFCQFSYCIGFLKHHIDKIKIFSFLMMYISSLDHRVLLSQYGRSESEQKTYDAAAENSPMGLGTT